MTPSRMDETPKVRAGRRRLRKVYLLPNLFTAFNLFLGFWAITEVIQGDVRQGAWLIFTAAMLDWLDGFTARLTRSQSEFGLQFDSLSDLISFGVAPAATAFYVLRDLRLMEKPGKLVLGVCGLFAVCGALRLARYNVQAKSVEKKEFTGLPIPASAGMVIFSILMLLQYSDQLGDAAKHLFQPAFIFLMVVLSLLMVSEVPYPSLPRMLRLRRRASFDSLIYVIFFATLLVAIWSYLRVEVIFTAGAAYVFGNLALYLFRTFFGSSTIRTIDLKNPSSNPETPNSPSPK